MRANGQRTLRGHLGAAQTGSGLPGSRGPPADANRIVAAGDSISQGFAADCSCNAGFFGLLCLLCPLAISPNSVVRRAAWKQLLRLLRSPSSGITSSRVSVSGAEMTSGRILRDPGRRHPGPHPDAGPRGRCTGRQRRVQPGLRRSGKLRRPLYDDATWTAAIERSRQARRLRPSDLPAAGGDGLPPRGPARTGPLCGGRREAVGVSSINCDARDDFNVCEIATLNAVLNGRTSPLVWKESPLRSPVTTRSCATSPSPTRRTRTGETRAGSKSWRIT